MAIPDYAVGTKFTAKDEVTPAYQRMERAADSFNRKATRGANDSASAMRNATKAGYQFGTVVKGILAANLIRGGIDRIANGIQAVNRDFIDLDDTLIGAAARFKDIGTEVSDFDQRVSGLKKTTRDAVLGTKFSAAQAAEVMNELAKADFTSAAATGVLRSQLQLASATNTDFAESIMYSNRLLGAFGMRSEDTNKQITSHIRLNDMLGKASNIANGDLTTLFETLKTAAPVGSLIGTTPEEMIAMGLAIDKAGIDASMAATSLKRAILNIGSADVQKELAANGIQITDNMGKFRRLSDIMGDIGNKLDAKGLARTPEMTQIFDRLFGKYGMAGVIGLIKNIDAVKEYEKALVDATGANQRMDDKLKKGLGYRLDVLGNQVKEFGFKILDAFEMDGKTGIEALTLAFAKFDPKPFIEGIKMTLDVVKGLWSILQPFMPYIPTLAKVFLGWKLVMIGMPIASMVSGLTGMTGILPMLTLQCAGLSAALWPIALAAGAIVAVWQAGKSLFTGQDNFISRAAQSMGLVPRLTTDSNGVVTGRAPDSQQSALVRSYMGIGSAISNMQFPSTDTIAAPNQREAQSRQQSNFYGRLDINAPPGSTFTQPQSAPGFNVNMLGAN